MIALPGALAACADGAMADNISVCSEFSDEASFDEKPVTMVTPPRSQKGQLKGKMLDAEAFDFLNPYVCATISGTTRAPSESEEDDLGDLEGLFDEEIVESVRRAWAEPRKVASQRRLRKLRIFSKQGEGDAAWRPLSAVVRAGAADEEASTTSTQKNGAADAEASTTSKKQNGSKLGFLRKLRSFA